VFRRQSYLWGRRGKREKHFLAAAAAAALAEIDKGGALFIQKHSRFHLVMGRKKNESDLWGMKRKIPISFQ
jgi:hypothetical protein